MILPQIQSQEPNRFGAIRPGRCVGKTSRMIGHITTGWGGTKPEVPFQPFDTQNTMTVP